jgi:hypothetical protein
MAVLPFVHGLKVIRIHLQEIEGKTALLFFSPLLYQLSYPADYQQKILLFETRSPNTPRLFYAV